MATGTWKMSFMGSVTPNTRIYSLAMSLGTSLNSVIPTTYLSITMQRRGIYSLFLRSFCAQSSASPASGGISLFGKSAQSGRQCSRLGRLTSFKTTADSGKAAPRQCADPPIPGSLSSCTADSRAVSTVYTNYKTKVKHLLDRLFRT